MKLNELIPRWNVTEMCGYIPQTTFWEDFSIADRFGNNAIQETFGRAFREWKSHYEYLTELVMVLNHKIWQWYDTAQKDSKQREAAMSRAKLYNDLWEQAEQYAVTHLQGDELSYFYNTTD